MSWYRYCSKAKVKRKLIEAWETQGLILHVGTRRHVNWVALLPSFPWIRRADSTSGFPNILVKNLSSKKHLQMPNTFKWYIWICVSQNCESRGHLTFLPHPPPLLLPRHLKVWGSWTRCCGLLWLLRPTLLVPLTFCGSYLPHIHRQIICNNILGSTPFMRMRNCWIMLENSKCLHTSKATKLCVKNPDWLYYYCCFITDQNLIRKVGGGDVYISSHLNLHSNPLC